MRLYCVGTAATLIVLTSIGSLAIQTTPVSRSVAFTFDDLPVTRGDGSCDRFRTRSICSSPRKHHTDRPSEAWLNAGFDLGNHTYSHVAIDRVPFETYRADLIRGETVTRRLLEARGRRLRYFRHPQLRTGPTPEYKAALDALLAERHYRVAPVTVDNNDFVFADVYARAKAAGDRDMMARVVEAYVPYLRGVVAHFERVSREFLGYEIRQILLLHANELNADHLDAVIDMLKARGYRFITLDAALEDPAYTLPEAQAARGLSWLHRWMLAKGLLMQGEPLEPSFIRASFNRAQP